MNIKDINKTVLANPANMQMLIAEKITGEEKDVIIDSASPAALMIDCISQTGNSLYTEIEETLKPLMASKINSMDDVMLHMSDEDYVNKNAIPATGLFTFFLNKNTLLNEGIKIPEKNKTILSIPELTNITVDKVTFTLLNAISISIQNNSNVHDLVTISSAVSTYEMGIKGVGLIEHTIFTDEADIQWIVFTVPIRQIKINKKDLLLTSAGRSFKESITLEDKIYKAVMFSKDSNGKMHSIKTIENNFTYDPTVPTIITNIIENVTTIEVPSIYIHNGSLKDKIYSEIYSTKGKVNLNFSNNSVEDFQIDIPSLLNSPESSVLKNMNLFVRCTTPIEGGRDSRTFEKIKENIIKNKIGNVNHLPITSNNIKQVYKEYGFDINIVKDTLSERIYVANKFFKTGDDESVNVLVELYNLTTKNIMEDMLNNRQVIVKNDTMIFKEDTIFKTVDGITTLLTNDELVLLDNISKDKMAKYLSDKKYFYTPFHIICDNVYQSGLSRNYLLSQPEVTNLTIVNKNIDIDAMCNINTFSIDKINDGYSLKLYLLTNEALDVLSSSLFLQLRVKLLNGSYLTYKVPYHQSDKSFVVHFETEAEIDVNDLILMLNGEANTLNKSIPLHSEMDIIIYTTSPIMDLGQDYIYNAKIDNPGFKNTAIVVQSINVELGTRMDNLWNYIENLYTSRKLQRYDEVVYATHPKDVYVKSVIDNFEAEFVINEDATELTFTKLHRAGDPIIDPETNQPTILHNVNDIKYDSDGYPLVDQIGGVVRFVDILAFDFVFKVANNDQYSKYKKSVLNTLVKWLKSDLNRLKESLIDGTDIYFKPNRDGLNVMLSDNNGTRSAESFIRPTITLYMNHNPSIAEVSNYKILIGKVLQKHTNKNVIVLNDIRTEILSIMDEKENVNVRITGFTDDNREVIQVRGDNRFTLKKDLDLNITTREFNLVYDFDLKIDNVTE